VNDREPTTVTRSSSKNDREITTAAATLPILVTKEVSTRHAVALDAQ
jgi:hypothetical protein